MIGAAVASAATGAASFRFPPFRLQVKRCPAITPSSDNRRLHRDTAGITPDDVITWLNGAIRTAVVRKPAVDPGHPAGLFAPLYNKKAVTKDFVTAVFLRACSRTLFQNVSTSLIGLLTYALHELAIMGDRTLPSQNFRLAEVPMTDFHQRVRTGAYSGGTVRDLHPVPLSICEGLYASQPLNAICTILAGISPLM